MALGDIRYWRAQFISSMQGQSMVTTFAIKDDPDDLNPNPLGAGGLADELDTWLGALYALHVTIDGSLDAIKVTEIPSDPHGIPDAHEKAVARAGGRDNSGDQLPDGVVAWNKVSTGAAIRSGHGGWFSLPAVRRLNLATTGLFDTGTTFWTSQTNINNALLAGHDYGTSPDSGHLSFVLYSRTRHLRGESTYLFDVTSISRAARVHWLRSRDE